MEDGIVIPLKANDKQIKQATKSLGILEKALNWVGKATGENKDELAKFADILSPFASVAPAFASAIKSYIIAPLSGAVNGFMALGDQISKTFQRIGIGVESLSGVGAARRELSYSHGRNIVNFYHRCGVPLFRNKKAGIMEFIH